MVVYLHYQILTTPKIKIMNTFTITFRNAMGSMKTEVIQLDFVTVQGVQAWFDETLGLRIKSISKH